MAVSWIKSGPAGAALAKAAAAQQEQRASSKGKMWRFFLAKGEECQITFIDGALNANGELLPPRYFEHNVQIQGKWGNTFVCPEQTNPEAGHKCPLCEQGERPALVTLFTVLDHRSFESKKEAGASYTNTPKLLVVKTGTFEVLQKIAYKRGGLAGVRFDVSRSNDDKSAAVGSMFDFCDKKSIEELTALYTKTYMGADGKQVTTSAFTPANYENEIVYRTPDELRSLGFGATGYTGSAPAFGGGNNSGGHSGNNHSTFGSGAGSNYGGNMPPPASAEDLESLYQNTQAAPVDYSSEL